MRSELHFDAVVIGGGTAGLTAGIRLAQDGARVCVLAKGHGSTHLAPATIDVLGYAPDLVTEPARAVEELIAARPDHPYALIGSEVVADAVHWFATTAADGPQPGYAYTGLVTGDDVAMLASLRARARARTWALGRTWRWRSMIPNETS